jgi:hypothetical protein
MFLTSVVISNSKKDAAKTKQHPFLTYDIHEKTMEKI